jgi:hypothetical protein
VGAVEAKYREQGTKGTREQGNETTSAGHFGAKEIYEHAETLSADVIRMLIALMNKLRK